MTNSRQFFETLSAEEGSTLPLRLQKIYKLLTYEASPVLHGVKPAVLVNIRKERDSCAKCVMWERCLRYIEGAMGLTAVELSVNETRLSILLFDPAQLHETLHDGSAVALLARYGYPIYDGGNAMALLEHLRRRCRGERFPHEVGIFLGYPPHDVEAFIRNKGQDCKLCGYWKVYHDDERAAEQFRRMDAARERMAGLINDGVPYYKAAKALG